MSDAKPITDPEAETEVLDDEPRNILLGLISQLRKGMDLHRVALPTFVLEPRSMLERLTDFMSHPDILLKAVGEKDELERFLLVLKYFLSGWHIRPKGVKKPYNPALSEFFRCQWKVQDPLTNSTTEAYYLAEQVSHHPPISAYYYTIPSHRIQIAGELRPKSKFLGNSAASMMHGENEIHFKDYPGEVYTVSNPNIYARGLLFGTMLMELGDSCLMKCEKTGYTCELDFVTKGTYNAIKGKIKNKSGEVLFNLSGKWTDVIYITKNQKHAQQEVFFDVSANPICLKQVYPEDKQEEYESRRLWSKVTTAMLSRDLDTATKEKNLIEDRQRKIRHDMKTDHDIYDGRFFHCKHENKENWKCELEEEFSKQSDGEKFKEKVVDFLFTNPNPPVKL